MMDIQKKYRCHTQRKKQILGALVLGCLVAGALGLYKPLALAAALLDPDGTSGLILWQIRLPRILTALVAGAGLAGAGVIMQSVLNNPLASPFTLGISHGAGFGAALAVMVIDPKMHGGTAITLGAAFSSAMLTALFIIRTAKIRGANPQTMVLTGVALGALFTAGTMFLQYFADDVQLAAMVFWTFGDTARTHWQGVATMAGVTGAGLAYFQFKARHYNAMDLGDDTAQGMGIPPFRTRIGGMAMASLMTAVIISFVGIIGFVGLVAPHMLRRILGCDHGFLIPGSALAGALVLMGSDWAAQYILAPHVLPVSIFTAFIGAPIFMAMLEGSHGL